MCQTYNTVTISVQMVFYKVLQQTVSLGKGTVTGYYYDLNNFHTTSAWHNAIVQYNSWTISYRQWKCDKIVEMSEPFAANLFGYKNKGNLRTWKNYSGVINKLVKFSKLNIESKSGNLFRIHWVIAKNDYSLLNPKQTNPKQTNP